VKMIVSLYLACGGKFPFFAVVDKGD